MWKGRETTDPEGYRCRIGALWARLFLQRGWAMVVRGIVWFRDEKTFAAYLRDDFWRAHEHHHVWQEKHRFCCSLAYLVAFLWQYVRYRSHDAAPLEIEADEAAREYLAGREPQ